MLDLSFRLLGRSELRLHAYPVLREYVLRGRPRSFVAVPPAGEVTYIWGAGPDEAAMRTAYGQQMPAHCAEYFDGATPGKPAAQLPAAGARRRDVAESASLRRPARFAVGRRRRSACSAPARRCSTTRGARWHASACSGTGRTTARS
ncbi:MAG: hypothetical protein M0C28_16590 [Candidatus Moduliflexus flocculans]|nr:hypothetical protein [Candidatus Moduliflexus flocculans]